MAQTAIVGNRQATQSTLWNTYITSFTHLCSLAQHIRPYSCSTVNLQPSHTLTNRCVRTCIRKLIIFEFITSSSRLYTCITSTFIQILTSLYLQYEISHHCSFGFLTVIDLIYTLHPACTSDKVLPWCLSPHKHDNQFTTRASPNSVETHHPLYIHIYKYNNWELYFSKQYQHHT